MMIKAGRTQLRESLFHCGITLVLWFTACSAASFAKTHGRLRVHAENPRYFADASGQAILLTGSHTWNNLIDIGPDNPPQPIDFDAYLKWLKAHERNFPRGWTWEPTRWDTSATKNVERNRERLTKAREASIYVSVMLRPIKGRRLKRLLDAIRQTVSGELQAITSAASKPLTTI